MALSVVIDGYNLIKGTARWGRMADRSLEEAREALVKALAGYRRVRGHPVLVVFDGKGHEGPVDGHTVSGGVHVLFSRPPEDADDVLKRLALKGREACVIVTSDNEVSRFATRAGATVVSCEEFQQRLLAARAHAGETGVQEDADEEEPAGGRQRLLTKKKGNPRRRSKIERKRLDRLRKL